MRSPLEELRAMRVSYSQFGEDLVVRTLFAENFDNSMGQLVDIGRFTHSSIQTQYYLVNSAHASST